MGNEQCKEADYRCNDIAKTEARKHFEHHGQDDTAPADEDGSRVEIRNRRTAGDIDSSAERESVQHECETNQPDRRAPKRLAPTNPGKDAEEEGDQVQNGREIERAQ